MKAVNWVLFLSLLVLAFCPQPGWASNWGEQVVIEDEYALTGLTFASSLVVLGTVNSVEIGCAGERRSFAEVEISADEVWKGWCPDILQIRVPGVRNEDGPCRSGYDGTRPETIKPGVQYLFICWSNWDHKKNIYLEGYRVPYGGMLGYDAANDEVYSFGDSRVINVPDSGRILREYCHSLSPEVMYERADLVVVATDFKLPGGESDFVGQLAMKNTSARVLRVLKGVYSDEEFVIDPLLAASWFRVPRINSDDTALLFLKKVGEEYGLLEGVEGYMLVQDGRILDKGEKPTGRYFDASWKILKEVKK